MGEFLEPKDFIIARKRKKYKFALFHNSPYCFEQDAWDTSYVPQAVEIGAGTSLFSVEQAMTHPEVNFLAIDVKGDRLQKGARLAEERSLKNIRFLRARADQLTEVLPLHCLDTLWLTFPDPFPKKRSRGRRLTHPRFLRQYTELLKADGALYFKTDAHDLFEWSLEQFVRQGWGMRELSFDLHESDLADWYKIHTTYEARFIAEGLKINFVQVSPPGV